MLHVLAHCLYVAQFDQSSLRIFDLDGVLAAGLLGFRTFLTVAVVVAADVDAVRCGKLMNISSSSSSSVSSVDCATV